MTLVGRLRERWLWAEIQRRHDLYAAQTLPSERRDWQLSRFNDEWQRIAASVPYYAAMKKERSLPDAFLSWQEFADRMPVTTRALVQLHGDEMMSQEKPPQWWRITGGSTGEPTHLPAWHSENRVTAPDQWLGRVWWGAKPGDRLFLLWGHRHLMGLGINGWINRRKRSLMDWMLGYCRYLPFSMGESKMRHAGEVLLRARPDYIYGYSTILDAFARANEDRARRFDKLGLKVVIATGEVFPLPESREMVGEILGAPMAMEYGAIETNVMAYCTPSGHYQVFWRNHFVEAVDQGVGGGRVVRITSLYPRCFPLVRYELGDEIELDSPASEGLGVSRFKRVRGRCSDYVELPDGSLIHSRVFTNAIRPHKEITGYQVVQDGSEIRAFVTSVCDLAPEISGEIHARMAVIHPQLASVAVERVDALEQTVAGKTPLVIRRAEKRTGETR
jgi:phenylacetate-CoA ligase